MPPSLFTVLAGLIVFVASSHAQLITWNSPLNMVGDLDVSTSGTYFGAASFYSSAVSVNGVTFNTLPGGTDGIISINAPNGTGTFGSPFSSLAPSSVSYSNITSVLGFGFFTPGTVTLSGLTLGNTYQVQAWSYWSGEGAGPTTTFSGANSVTLNSQDGQYAIGTFTATGATETFDYTFVPTEGHAIINAVSVRDVTAIPEPSTVGLVSVALGLFGMLVRRSKARLA